MRFTVRLVLLLLILSVAPIALMGHFGYVIGRDAALDRIRSHLAGVNALKRADLQRWLEDLGATLEGRAQRPLLRDEVVFLAEHQPDTSDAALMREAVINDHLSVSLGSTGFESLSVLRASDGVILVSSDPALQGLDRSAMLYFQQGLLGTFLDRVRISALTGLPEMHVATPIMDRQGRVIAVLAGHANLQAAAAVMRQAGGLGVSEESYLLDDTQHLVTALRIGAAEPLETTLATTPARACAQGEQGIAFFISYADQHVLGAFAPVGQAGLCLVTEVSRDEVLRSVNRQRDLALALGLTVSALVVIVGVAFTRSVRRVLGTLLVGVRTFALGDLNHRIPAIGPPDTRRLSSALNDMAALRQQAEARLTDATGLVQTIIEGAPVGIVTYREDGQAVWVNAAATEIVGLPREFMATVNFRTIPAWRESGLLAAAERALQSGSGEHIDVHMTTSAPKEVWLECFLTPFSWAGGKHLLLLMNDRSERVRTQEELERHRQHLEELVAERTAELSAANRHLSQEQATLRALVDALPDWVVLTDVDGHIRIANAAAVVASRRAPEALVGAAFFSLLPEPLVSTHLSAIEQALATRAPAHYEETLPGYVVEGAVCPVLDAEGRVVSLAHFGRDVSEVRRAQQERIQALADRVAILDAMSDGLFVMEPGGRVRAVNGALLKLLDVTREDLVGQDVDWLIAQFVAPEEKRAAHELLQRVRTGADVELDSLTLALPYGRRLVVSVRSSRQLDAQGQAQGVILTLRDQMALERARQELERSNRELEQFAYVASHDLQEPLRMVSSYTQLLARRYQGKLDADADQFIHFAVDGANRMQRMVNDLLALSRVNTRGRPLVPVPAQEPLLRAIETLHFAIQEQGAQVTYDPLPTVLADESQLVQLLQNLLSNAIKFHRPGVAPVVHVSAAPADEPGWWRISVRDNGIGIEPQYHQRIFQLFQRLHGRDEYPGTGIGLAVCQRIVERHGGHIEVESVPGQGTTFSVTLQGA